MILDGLRDEDHPLSGCVRQFQTPHVLLLGPNDPDGFQPNHFPPDGHRPGAEFLGQSGPAHLIGLADWGVVPPAEGAPKAGMVTGGMRWNWGCSKGWRELSCVIMSGRPLTLIGFGLYSNSSYESVLSCIVHRVKSEYVCVGEVTSRSIM